MPIEEWGPDEWVAAIFFGINDFLVCYSFGNLIYEAMTSYLRMF
jgi:hypothetical protein